MTFIVTRNTSAACQPPVPPLNPETGERFPLAANFSGGWKWVWAEDVDEILAVLMGDPDYVTDPDPQSRLVSRIKIAMRMAVILQAEQIHEAQCDGRWGKLMEAEKAMLLAPRIRQPAGLYSDLFGQPVWVAEVPLVVVSSGYMDERPMPQGSSDRIWVLDPISSEDLLESLAATGAIRFMFRSTDE